MIPLGHQVNNKPLIIALGIAFVLHFFFTLTYHIDFEGTALKPSVLNITLTDTPTKTAVIEPEVIKPSAPRAVTNLEPETIKTDYLAGEQ